LLTLGLLPVHPGYAAGASPALSGGDQRVIVIFQNQHVDLSSPFSTNARQAAISSDQAPIISQLNQIQATNVTSFHLVNAIAATVPTVQVAALQADAGVKAVVPDMVVHELKPLRLRPEFKKTRLVTPASLPKVPTQDPCSVTPPSLEPEALQQTETAFNDSSIPQESNLVDGNGKKIDGRGVTVAFLADGIDTSIPDYQRNGSPVITDYQDFSGDGIDAATAGGEAFLDASSIAAQGNTTYDVNTYVDVSHQQPNPCNIKVRGMAPGADLMALKVFNADSESFTSGLIAAVQYAVDNGADVINESLGGNVYPDLNLDPLVLANDAAVAQGVGVVAASGDEGTANTVGTPASDPNIIAAGATTQFRSYAQNVAAGIQLGSGNWASNNISSFSSAGVTNKGNKAVDVVAGGDLGWSDCSSALAADSSQIYADCTDDDGNPANFDWIGGTSESSPLTAGEAALVIQAYRSTHNNVRPSPQLVKQIIMSTANDLGYPSQEQGAGEIDSLRAVRAALSVHDGNGAPTPQGVSLLTSPGALSAEAPPNTPQSFQVTVTNVASSYEAILPAVRALAPPQTSTDYTINLDPTTTTQTFVDQFGVTRAYATQTFTVQPSAQRLDAAISWNVVSEPFTIVRLDLFDPKGNFEAWTFPGDQGEPFPSSGYGHVDVRRPMAGTWTAVVWTISSSVPGAEPYSGPVHLTVSTSHFFAPRPALAPFSIAPGQTRTFSVPLTTPSQPGDQNDDVVIQALGPGHSSTTAGVIPVYLRSLVPLGAAGGSFAGVLTGGNGTIGAGSPGQVLTYRFDVPSGKHDLDLGLRLNDSHYNLSGFLVDPSGQVRDVQSTATRLKLSTGLSTAYTNTMQFFRRDPAAGRWTFILMINNNVSGAQTSEPFTGTITLDGASVLAPTMPHGATITAGNSVTVPITIKNTGNTAKTYFADPRLTTTTTVTLPTEPNAGPFDLPLMLTPPLFPGPFVIVPPETSYLDVKTTTASPLPSGVSLLTELAYSAGTYPNGISLSPDVLGTGPEVSLSAPELLFGEWGVTPQESGNFTSSPAPAESATITARATMRAFDPNAMSDTGDEWADLINGTNTFTKWTVQPGQTRTFNLKLTAQAGAGSVSGTVYVDTLKPQGTSPSLGPLEINGFAGDEVAAIPYSYTVPGP
jgi:hypothetical protein